MSKKSKTFQDGERQYFTFFRSWRDSLNLLPPDSKIKLFDTILDAGLDGIEPLSQDLKDIEKLVWFQIRPIIFQGWEIAKARQHASYMREQNKGGAPKGNKNAANDNPKEYKPF